MRRFWQIEIRKPTTWDDLNKIDFLQIWKSVDEEAECYLLPYLDEISAIQHKELTSKTNSTIFATEYCSIDDAHEIQAETLLHEFRSWEEFHDPNKRTASRHFFQQLLFIPGVRRFMKKNRSHYNVKFTGERRGLSLLSKVGAVADE